MGPLPSRAASFLIVIISAIAFKVRVLAQSATNSLPYPYNQPWPAAEKHGAWPPAQSSSPTATQPQPPAETPPQQTIQPPPATTPAQTQDLGNQNQNGPGANPGVYVPGAPPPAPGNNVIGFSGDFLVGQGHVTLPVLYSLSRVLPKSLSLNPHGASANRNSIYGGGEISYSFGQKQAWYFDFAYRQGSSTGNTPIPIDGSLPSQFSIDDTWYQAYVRYSFPSLRGKGWSAYARAGVTYIQATLNDTTQIPALGLYHQTDDTTDVRGNLGFGLRRDFNLSERWQVGLQAEGEGFFGTRSQSSLETLASNPFHLSKSDFKTANINNTLYGGTGRMTVHTEYRLGHSGLMKIFADGGLQADFMEITYPSSGSLDELLWGPYVKLGLTYQF